MSEPAIRVGVRELRANFSEYVQRVRLGASFVVVSRGVPVAELRAPVATAKSARRPGALQGRISMTDDFDSLPPDVLDAFEDRLA